MPHTIIASVTAMILILSGEGRAGLRQREWRYQVLLEPRTWEHDCIISSLSLPSPQ